MKKLRQFKLLFLVIEDYKKQRHDIQHNDTQHKGTQDNWLVCGTQLK
jgi:hypothetical protein